MALAFESRTHVDKGSFVVDGFETMVGKLRVSSQDITGDVLIVSPGSSFFEKKLLGSENSLTVVDLHSDPRDSKGYYAQELHPGQQPSLYKGAQNYYPWSLEQALTGLDEPIFDRAVLLRVADFQGQFPGLLAAMQTALKPDGLLIGSGGFDCYKNFKNQVNGHFAVEKVTGFANPDFYGKSYTGLHLGFVLKNKGL